MMILENLLENMNADLFRYSVIVLHNDDYNEPTLPISRDLIEYHALGDARQIKFRHDWLMERMKCSCNGWGRKGNQINCGNRR